jgi:uncharacterized tellurite resistance protein B-like protein
MLNEIKRFLQQHLDLESSTNPDEDLVIASVAFCLEMVIFDELSDFPEGTFILTLVKNSFSLNDSEALALIADVEQQCKRTSNFLQFSTRLNNSCSLDEKIQLVKSLWKIALSETPYNAQIEYFVRKIASALLISHADFFMAKSRETFQTATPDMVD